MLVGLAVEANKLASTMISDEKARLAISRVGAQLTLEGQITVSPQPSLVLEDLEYVSKKLGFSREEFIGIITQPNRQHDEFGTDARQRRMYWSLIRAISPVTGLLRKLKIRS